MKVYKIGEYRERTVISNVKFEDVQTHETFDRNGQEVGYYEAQASLEIITEKAAQIANCETGDFVYATDSKEFYDVLAECEQDKDYRIESPTVKAYSYWNGNNWKTLVLETDFGYPDLEEVTGEEADKIMEAYENKEFSNEGFGSKTYTCGEYTFIETQFASDWYDAEVFIN